MYQEILTLAVVLVVEDEVKSKLEDMCIINLFLDDNPDNILLMYPHKLCNEKILQDNIVNMKKYIREYINESEQYRRCTNIIPDLIWDSQKIAKQNEADEHQRKANKLSDKINEGIAPYAWYYKENFNQYINGIHYRARYVVYLDDV